MAKTTKTEKIIIAGVDLTDYVAEENRISMELFGTPSEDVTPSDLLNYVLSEATTIEQREAVLNEYKVHPEKYPDMDTNYDIYTRKKTKKTKYVIAMLERLAKRDPQEKLTEVDCCF